MLEINFGLWGVGFNVYGINEHINKTVEDYSEENGYFYSGYILVGVKK